MKRGHEYKTVMNQKVLYNRWMNITPFAKDTMEQWRRDMHLDVVREGGAGVGACGRVVGFANYDKTIHPYDMKGIKGITNVVPEFSLLANYYSDLLHRHFQHRYFGTLCDVLMTEEGGGYRPGENLLGMPYDSRLLLDPGYREGYFKTLRETLEGCVEKPLVITHSLGGVLLKWFLMGLGSVKDIEHWIQQYIGHLIIINPPFGGTTMAMRVILSGEYYVPMFHQEFKASLQKISGILMCLPNTYAYDPEEPLVKLDNPGRTLRIGELTKTTTIENPAQVAFDIWRDMYLPHLPTIMTPVQLGSVPCDILIGTQQPTMRTIQLKKEGEMPYETKYELGDGQVPWRSLILAKDIFVGSHVTPLDCGHIDVLSSPFFLEMVKSATKGI